MIAISAHDVTPAIAALFDLAKPTMPRAINVLEGITGGHIVVDNVAQPTWAAVRDAAFGTLYIGGQVNAAPLAQLVEHFRQRGGVGIGCWLDDPLNNMLPPDPNYDGRTLYFTDRSPDVALQPLIRQLPEGYALVNRDERWFAQSVDHDDMLAVFGSLDNVLRSTFGVMLIQNDVVLSEAGSGAPTHGMIEVGVATTEANRQRGFATIACAALVEMCEAQGYATWWDCAKGNIPSAKIARKLGYQNEREYRYVWWEQRS